MTPPHDPFPDVERARLRRAATASATRTASPACSRRRNPTSRRCRRSTTARRAPRATRSRTSARCSAGRRVAARTLTARDGHYGHIVLSRWPIESLGEIDLSVRWREPRKAIVGAVATPAGRIVVVAAHLGLLPFERRRQFARLKERIATITERPLVVLGDFNDFPGRGLAERSLCPPLTATPELRDLSVAAAAAAARPHLVQRAARAHDDRDAARRGPCLGSPAACSRACAGLRRRGGRWHGVCLDKQQATSNAGRPNG